jgi:AcrR family transcriptional regulator
MLDPGPASMPRLRTPKARPIRDAARTKARILEKATRLFAKSGFEGTSAADIVAAAKINKRMLFYYFGDKKGLYRAVFIKQWGELKSEFDRKMAARLASGEPLSTREALMEVLGLLFDFMASHHDLLRLMMWEGLEGGAISRSIWWEVRGPLFQQAVFLIEHAQREGLIAKDVDPAHYIVTWLGAVTFYFAYAHTMTDMIGKKPLSPEAVQHRRQQLLALQEKLFEK